ncbi:phosphoribosylaminoimidazolesuccinocarboxamide synthase [Loigolactobacillus zhaoyuanensis]|uniref:Phosphoribosylaminoimidazole-succinocarboxamide synthase n=1 Tax=Loigolactobacillus zhaoyuanensis TaxID=2486017 RepID=A0ABW8U8J0_9LACO|nr:phosphoribosylaminoimidazolesuccinocarboxamide synthase [Loigolactobacillus zhaoyuanensis]
MRKLKELKTGKAKRLYTTDDPEVLWVEYLDQATALNGKRKEQIATKGALNNQIDSLLFDYLIANGVPTDFIRQVSATEQLIHPVKMIPLEVVVRNLASGSFQRKFATDYLQPLKQPIVELFYKSDELDDPFMNDDQVTALGIASAVELVQIKQLALQINQLLIARFAQGQLTLVDFKIEVGYLNGQLVLADEISPDSCRLVDTTTQESLDKDVFRKHTGDLTTVYREVLTRLQNSEVAHVSR